MTTIASRARDFVKRHRSSLPVAFFLIGFLYDAISLDRIDSWTGIAKHGAYLGIIALILGMELLEYAGRFKPAGRMARVWVYQELAIHFFLGSLLSEYTLFFFKSSSLWSSFAFIMLLGFVLMLNEFKQFQGSSGIPVRAALFSICLVSYFVYLVPVIQGYVGTVPFLLSLVGASILVAALTKVLRGQMADQAALLKKQLLLPFATVVGVFFCLYFTHLIPPIPLAIRYMGIFHEIGKENGVYRLGYTRPAWKFWQKGDQTFLARPGDKVHFFVRVFSPSRFSDSVIVKWYLDDPKRGWQQWDAVPMNVTGGRGEGYRGYIYKSNYQPGDWQVRTETTDGRELGRIYFTVEADESTEEREVRYRLD